MLASLFHNVIYLPIYNLLVFLVDVVPGGDFGIAVILTTIMVKLVMMPLSLSAAKTQRRMKRIEPQLKEIKEKHKASREEQAKQMMALYKEHEIRPFSSLLGILIQLPILFALYFVTLRMVNGVNPEYLYAFIPQPEAIAPLFLGIFAVAGSSVVLAALAGIAQFASAYVSIPVPKVEKGVKTTAAEDFGRMMAVQARFVLPVVIGVAAYFTSGAVALYFITSSVMAVAQEYIVRRLHPDEPKLA